MRLAYTLATSLTLVAILAVPPTSAEQYVELREIARLEGVWDEAHLHGDADALDKLLADDLVLTVPKMPVMSKADVLGMWRSVHVQFKRYETSNAEIRVYGDAAAVVTGRLQRSRDFGGRVADEEWQFTKVYIRRADKWQVVAFHASEAAQ